MSERAEPDALGQGLDLEARQGEQPLQQPQPEAMADEADDAPDDFARASIRRVVSAADAERLQPVARLRAPVSIFNPASVAMPRPRRRKGPKLQAARGVQGVEQWVKRVEREHGLVRLVRVPFAETEAWRVKEEARRAKQRPPKPCAAMRRHKSAKLRKLLGIDLGLDD